MADGRWPMAKGNCRMKIENWKMQIGKGMGALRGLADEGADGAVVFDVGVGGEGAGPGDVAVAGRVEVIAAFAEDPARGGVTFSQGEVIGGDVVLGFGEAFLGGGELVHEGEAEVVFFAGEIDGSEAARETFASVPTDLLAEAGAVAGGLETAEGAQEGEEDGGEQVPVFGAGGEEGAEPEFIADGLIDVDDSEAALAAGGDIEAEAEGFSGLKELKELVV